MYIRPWSDSSHWAPSKFTKGCLEDASDRKEFDSTPTLRLPRLSRDTPSAPSKNERSMRSTIACKKAASKLSSFTPAQPPERPKSIPASRSGLEHRAAQVL